MLSSELLSELSLLFWLLLAEPSDELLCSPELSDASSDCSAAILPSCVGFSVWIGWLSPSLSCRSPSVFGVVTSVALLVDLISTAMACIFRSGVYCPMLALSLGVLLSSLNGATICSVGVIVDIWPRVWIVPELYGPCRLLLPGPLDSVFLLPLKSLPPSFLKLLFVDSPCSFRK